MVGQITPRELRDRLLGDDASPLLLDVREPWEYGICHIDGSRLLPMRTVVSALDELDPDRELVVICHHGIRSQQVALYLQHQGFQRVANLRGGVDAWARDIDPDMATY
jgi:rhodanese-related sulfurtransferase